MSEKIQIDYDHQTEYSTTENNAVGATTSLTLRTLDTISGNTAYVKKFGSDYSIAQVTDIEDPVDVDMTYSVYSLSGTLLGSRVGGGAFVAGSTVASQGCYLVVSATGNCTLLADFDLDTNIDAGGLNFICPAEALTAGQSLRLYLSTTGSTYYDTSYKYGGGRHTPALDNTRKPYFTIATAYAALNSANDGVVINDSEWYDEELTFDRATTFIHAALGQTPTITKIIGASIYRDVSAQYNNTTALYFNENGNDSTGTGTWQNPYDTCGAAITAAGSTPTKSVVYGGTGATATGYISYTEVEPYGTIESDYGYTPTIGFIDAHAISLSLRGLIIDGNQATDCVNLDNGAYTYNIYNCNIQNGVYGIRSMHSPASYTIVHNIYYNKIYNCINQLYYQYPVVATSTYTSNIVKNIMYNGSQNGIRIEQNAGAGASTTNGSITNNVIYNISYYGMYINNIGGGTTYAYTIRYNTLFKNLYGIYLGLTATALNINYNIFHTNTTYGIWSDVAITITYNDFYLNGTKLNANVTSNNELVTDPKLISTIIPYKFGLSADSPCLKTNGAEADIGLTLNNVIIAANSITINGIIFNGLNLYCNAICKTGSSDYTGLILKWCTIKNYQGISIDDYSGANTTTQILNCNINNNGSGVKFSYGGNTVTNCLLYRNSTFGIKSNYTVSSFTYNTFYLNQYNLYLDASSSGITIKNNISNNSSLYGIYSNTSIIISYNDINDLVNSLVDNSSTTNLTESALFINTNTGEENFYLKTVNGGYTINSPCINTSSDGIDLGCYTVTRSTTDNAFRKYTLSNNPLTVNKLLNLKNPIEFYDILGNLHSYTNADKLVIPLSWGNNTATTKEQRLMIRYFQSLIPSRQNGKTESECEFRVHLLPSAYYGSGTSGVISSTAKTLTDSTASWYPNEKKGWWVSVKFLTGTATGTITASTKKIAISPSPSWTNDQYVGYFLHHNGYYYYITDNDSDELTLSDPNSTLTDSASINWEIVKYFKIEKNTSTVLTLTDDDSELVTGTYAYFIDFILCRVKPENFKYSQPVYDFTDDISKSGYDITFEEID